MGLPPFIASSLKGDDQIFNSFRGENRSLAWRLMSQIGGGNRYVTKPTGEQLNLAVTDVTGKASQTHELERPPGERMAGVNDRNLTFAFLRDQRGITLVEVCPFPVAPINRHWHARESTRNVPVPGSSVC